MKKVLTVVLLSAMLTLTACDKTESSSESAPQSAEGYIPPIASTAPESTSESSESVSDGSSETSDTSSESEPDCPYKVGDLVGPEDLPSRGRAAYTVTKKSIYLLKEELNESVVEIFDEYDNSLYRERGYGEPEICSYEYDSSGKTVRQYYSADKYIDTEYDANGLDIVHKHYEDGKLHMLTEISYDEHGELTEWISTYCDLEDGTDVVLLHTIYENEYDENGRMIAYTAYNSDHEVRDSTVCEYDDRGVLRHQVRTESRSGGGTSVREWYFDELERQIMRTVTYTDSDGTVTSPYREELTYNEDGKLAECLHYNTKEDEFLELREVYTYQYE